MIHFTLQEQFTVCDWSSVKCDLLHVVFSKVFTRCWSWLFFQLENTFINNCWEVLSHLLSLSCLSKVNGRWADWNLCSELSVHSKEWTLTFRQSVKWLMFSFFLCSDWFVSRKSTNASLHNTFPSSLHRSSCSLLLNHKTVVCLTESVRDWSKRDRKGWSEQQLHPSELSSHLRTANRFTFVRIDSWLW
jgi:hypothetical protein